MATTTGQLSNREVLEQTGPIMGGVAVCTAVLTAAFLGVVALVSGEALGAVARLPLYVLASSVVFVGVILVVDDGRVDGRTVLGRAVATALAGFVLAGLGAEGTIYALTNPHLVVASHLFLYLLAAAIIASGFGYWTVQHWREMRHQFATKGL